MALRLTNHWYIGSLSSGRAAHLAAPSTGYWLKNASAIFAVRASIACGRQVNFDLGDEVLD
jgi:hypothetical protein